MNSIYPYIGCFLKLPFQRIEILNQTWSGRPSEIALQRLISDQGFTSLWRGLHAAMTIQLIEYLLNSPDALDLTNKIMRACFPTLLSHTFTYRFLHHSLRQSITLIATMPFRLAYVQQAACMSRKAHPIWYSDGFAPCFAWYFIYSMLRIALTSCINTLIQIRFDTVSPSSFSYSVRYLFISACAYPYYAASNQTLVNPNTSQSTSGGFLWYCLARCVEFGLVALSQFRFS